MMNHTARTTVALIATAGLALLAAACGGSIAAPSGSNPPVASAQPLAFSRCMRSNGVLKFADPNSSGVIPKLSPQQLGVSDSQFQSAQRACQHLLPTESAAQQQHVAGDAVKFSRCMRSHGVVNFPDPVGNGRIPDPASVGIDQGSPQFEAANQACRKYRPPYMPSNTAYNAWASTSGS